MRSCSDTDIDPTSLLLDIEIAHQYTCLHLQLKEAWQIFKIIMQNRKFSVELFILVTPMILK